MKITLVISTLGGGGAERMATNMANYWAAKQWEVTILTTGFGGESPCYEMHPRVTHLDLGSPRFDSVPTDLKVIAPVADVISACSSSESAVLRPNVNHILKLRGAILGTRPEVVISFIDRTNIRVLLATHGLGLPVIVSEQCDVNESSIGEGWELLRRRLYPQASYVTVLTEESLGYFSSAPGVRGRIIPNAVTPDVFSSSEETPPQTGGKTLLAMGRLEDQKGFDLLMTAFGFVAARHPDWTLTIVGEGPARSYLESCVHQRGLVGRVRMPGFSHRPFDVMRRADLFVLSSMDEGFGNVLIEAMACGLPVVSFDCPSGPRHIIRDGIDGVLVSPDSVHAMSVALEDMMGDEAKRQRLAARAPEVIERFGMQKVMSMWEDLVLDCASTRPELGSLRISLMI